MDFKFEPCPNCKKLMLWDSWDLVWSCTDAECPVYEISDDELEDIKQKLENQSNAQSQTQG